MNFRTTFLLLLLVAGAGAAYYYQDALAAKLGLAPQTAGAGSPTLEVIEVGHSFRPEALRRIEVSHDGRRVELVRNGQAWDLPGGWPARGAEVQELVDAIAGLDTRFVPIPVTGASNLKDYGLDKSQNPVEVAVTVEFPGPEKTKTHTLLFGEPSEHQGNPFARPTYVRLDGNPEVIQTAPGLLAVLTRPPDAYRKRQLFPTFQTVRIADARPTFPGDPEIPSPPIALLDAKSVTVQGPDGTWAIHRTAPPSVAPAKVIGEITSERLASRWEVAEPVADRPDPDRLKGVLAAVPELWVENFVTDPDPAKTGLDKPERTVQVDFDNRGPMKLLIGEVSRVVERQSPPPPPLNPLAPPPPPPPAVREEYRYAKLPDNPQVFEVRTDKFANLFLAPAVMRDAHLLRFRPGDVQRVEIAHPSSRIVVAKEKDESSKEDRWKLIEPIRTDADASKVTELLDRLGDLQANGPDVLDKADAKAMGLDPATDSAKVTLTVSEEAPPIGDEKDKDKDKPKQTRTLTLRLGKLDTAKKKLPVQVEGNSRIDLVTDDFVKLFDRPALAYRGRRVLDIPAGQVASITVQRGDEEYRLIRTDGNWKLAEPISATVDNGKLGQLTDDLRRLEAVEYVNDAPKPEELADYGLSQPALSATLTFADSRPPVTLLVGKAREGKPEVYAKLADGPAVFALPNSVKTAIDKPSLAFRPLQLWQLGLDSINAVEVQRGDEKYRVSREGTAWKLTGPFDAPASAATVQPILAQLTAPRVDRYEAHTTDDPAKYGFDKPELRVTVFATGEAGPKGLVIGKAVAADGTARYARLTDSGAVVVVPDSLVKAADRPALGLLDKQLLSLNNSLIRQIRGTGPEGVWELKRDGGDWQIASLTPPIPADRQAADTLLRTWADMRATSFAAYGPQTDFAKYGLDKPATSVTVALVTEEGKPPTEHTVALGQKAEGDVVYARVDNGPGVAVLPAALAHELMHAQLDFVDRTLLTFDPSGLTAIRRKAGDSELELNRTADGWQIVKPSALRADQQGTDDLAERLGELRAARIAALDATDLKPFGLDTPAAALTLVLKDKDGKPSEKVLQVGGVVPPRDGQPAAGEDRYARVEGANKVGVLPASLAKRLVAEPMKFQDRTIARFADADRAVVERGDRKATFAKVDGTWKMVEPIATDAEQTELDDLVNAVARLRADELVAEKPTDLTAYGLDKPVAHWHFRAGDRDVLHLLIGRRDDATGRNYAKLADGDVVFFLDGNLSHRLLAEYRKRSLWSNVDAAQVETLVYGVGDAMLVLQKADTGWQVAGKPGQAVKTDVVNHLFATLSGLKVERYVVDKGADLKLYGLDPPARTIVARTRTGATATLFLGHAEDGSKRVYGRVMDADRSDVFVLSEADSAKLVRELQDFTGK